MENTYGINSKTKTGYMKYILPDSVRDFTCIMGACEDNCCRNTTWSIIVDNNSYEKYKSLNNEVGKRILGCIDDTESALKFKEFDDGKCPLMLDNGLCYIHKELGAEFLCTTCASYPRNLAPFNNIPNYWLSLSCPEVVRHVLYRKKNTSFVENRMAVRELAKSKPQEAEKAVAGYLLAKVISYRKLNLKEKLLYMAVFMRSMGKLSLYTPNYNRTVRKTIKTYSDGLSDARKMLEQITNRIGDTQNDERNTILQILAAYSAQVCSPPKLHPEGIENEKYYTLMKNFHEDVKNGSAQKYIVETFDNKVVKYVNSKPHVFENYLTYTLMSSQFLTDSDNFANAFAGFAGEFATMLVFACMFHKYDVFGDEEMVVAIYLFHRRVSHSMELRKALAQKFTDGILVFLLSVLGAIK